MGTEEQQMRKIVAGLFITLDGVVEAPEKWQSRYFDDELGELIESAAAESDAMLLGRRTYEELAAFWPTQNTDVPLADYMNSTPKYIVSTTLDTLDWPNSSLVIGELAEELTELKQLPGKNIQIIGSPTLVRSLLRDGLLDELALMVHPIVVGGGTRLFADRDYGTTLTLVDSRILGSGVVFVTYAHAGVPAALHLV
jgi:dihydrofolate reductase